MKARYVVTFETDSTAKSVSGVVSAGSAQPLASKAIRSAKAQEPKSKWVSLVVVLTREGKQSKEDE